MEDSIPDGNQLQTQQPQLPVSAEDNTNKNVTLLALSPVNLQSEKIRFFDSDCSINPVFKFEDDYQPVIPEKHTRVHDKYLALAVKIMNAVIKQFGSEREYNQFEGGDQVDKKRTEIAFEKYIADLKCEGQLTFVFKENTITPTSCQHNTNGTTQVIIGMPILYRERRLQGVLHHEIGTHFIRRNNEQRQIWAQHRKEYQMEDGKKIEEGLALLNQKLDSAWDSQQYPYLFNAALHYYACIQASKLSFLDLFNDLQQYVIDKDKRWRECVRVKRGLLDTSIPGGMYKDQIYFIGAKRVLKYRNQVDFLKLHAGQMSVKDCIRLEQIIDIKDMIVPPFLEDIKKYKEAMDKIAEVNFIE